MLQFILVLIAGCLSLVRPSPVSAVQTRILEIVPTVTVTRPKLQATIKEVRKDLKEIIEDGRNAIKDIRASVSAERKELRETIQQRDLWKHMESLVIDSISGSTLTLVKEDKKFTILTGSFDECSTIIKRRYGGLSSLSELSVGDTVNVNGKFSDDTKSTMHACLLRDMSIQKRFGVFVGEITSISSAGFVMTTLSEKRNDQTVTLSATTKIINRKNENLQKSELKVGDRVRVKGLWNSDKNLVSEVSQVKDFSIPVSPTKNPSQMPKE